MAVKVNESTDSNYTLYTGVATMRVVNVNPSQQELKGMGFKAEKPPVYSSMVNVNGVQLFKTRIDFYLEGESPDGNKIKAKHPIFLSSKIITDVWIDNFGKFSKDQTKLTNHGLRNPYEGEVELLLFLAALCNVGKGDEIYLDTMGELATKGSFGEVRQTGSKAKKNEIKVLLGVKDGKYQQVYPKKIERGYSKDLSYLHKSYVDNIQHLKIFYGNIDVTRFRVEDYILKEYVPGIENVGQPKQNSGSPIGAVQPNTFNTQNNAGVNPNQQGVNPVAVPTGNEDDTIPF